MTENKWGRPGDWGIIENVEDKWGKCELCNNKWMYLNKYLDSPEHPDEYAALCPSCYQTHVVEPSEGVKAPRLCGACAAQCTEGELFKCKDSHLIACGHCKKDSLIMKNTRESDWTPLVNPITPALEPIREWSDDLVGKRVVCLKPDDTDNMDIGGIYHIKEGFNHFKGSPFNRVYLKECIDTFVPLLSCFALSPSQPGQEEGEKEPESKEESREEAPQPITEETFTASFDFKGERIDIPDPGEGWMYQGCALPWESIKKIYVDPDGSIDLILGGARDDIHLKTQVEQAVWFKEYETRINIEHPPIAIHRWTREPVIQEKYECLENYPLLNGRG